jgi:CcmD family protein
MNDIYQLVIPQAPYIIAAYGLIWVSLVVYVALIARRLTKTEQQMEVVESSAQRRAG